MTQVLILGTAFASLALGLHTLRQSFGKDSDQFERVNLVAWVLISLFPVMLIFSFFPGSEASGKVIGFSVGSAFGGFVLLFLLGTKRSLSAKRLDDLRRELVAREGEITALEDQCVSLAKRPQPLLDTRTMLYAVDDCPNKQIGVVTGNLSKVKFASIWVNSENTNMQMSRFFEDTVSATIRYLGSKRDHLGGVVTDYIGNELDAQMKGAVAVPPGHVLVTGPGELHASHNVKKLYHVASVHGQLGVGYRQITDVAVCVSNVLQLAEQEAWSDEESRSIIVPLLGANVGRGSLESTIEALFTAALDHFASNPNTSLDVVYFLAFTDVERDACIAFLQSDSRVSPLPQGSVYSSAQGAMKGPEPCSQ